VSIFEIIAFDELMQSTGKELSVYPSTSKPQQTRMPGFFIVLEGIDGCGKTTQIKALADWLPTSGLMPPGAKLVVTREPGGTPLGAALRKSLLNPAENQSPCCNAELLLYMADRAQHVETIIKPALKAGDWVLCDRFTASTIAYQHYGRGIPMSDITPLQNFATAGISPDLTIVIDISIEEALYRMRSKNKDRFETEDINFFRRVRQGYYKIKTVHSKAETLAGHVLVANGCSRKPEEVFAYCKNVIQWQLYDKRQDLLYKSRRKD
jgi:dTMP kinase